MPPGPTHPRHPRRGATVRVRDLRWGDFDDVTRAYWRLYDERDAGEPHGITLLGTKPTLSEEVTWFASSYRRMLDGDAIAVVGEVAGRVVGLCTISRAGRARDAEDGHVGVLGILVDRDHRGRGVGRALLREALGRAPAVFQVVRLGVWANNVRARRLYERFGFRYIGTYPNAHRRRGTMVDEDLMVLVFAGPKRGRKNR